MNQKMNLLFVLCIVTSVFFITPMVRADYMLPYPSVMPGNKLYKLAQIVDRLQEYWHFGSLAKIKYHLGLSDKYLVEAKTLFEYKQYLLAVDALSRSDRHFGEIARYVKVALEDGKDVTPWREKVTQAQAVHREVLESLVTRVPKTFTWTPEKAQATQLPLHQLLQNSIDIRKQMRPI